MEEDKLEMGMFDINHEFIFDDTENNFQNDEIEDQEDPNKNINDTVEDESSEEVDSEEDEENEGSDEDNDSDSSSNLYSSLAAVIHEQGLLPSLDINNTKIESVDDLVTALAQEQEIQAKLKLDEIIANIDTSMIAQATKEIQDLNTITEDSLKDNIDLAKEIIYQDYLNQGIGEKRASHLLKRIIDLGEDAILEDASESLNSLKEFKQRVIETEKQNALKQLEEEKIKQAELDKQIKSVIYDNKEPLKGLKVTKSLQDKVHKSMTEIVGKDPDGNFENAFMKARRQNPVEFEARMYFLYELTNGFTDYSKISTKAQSKAVNELERIAKQTKIKDNGTPNWIQDANSYFGPSGSVLNT